MSSSLSSIPLFIFSLNYFIGLFQSLDIFSALLRINIRNCVGCPEGGPSCSDNIDSLSLSLLLEVKVVIYCCC